MHRRVPWATSCSWAPSSATWSSPSAVRAALAGNSAVRSGVVVKRMLTTSSCVSSLRAKSSFTRVAVLASISALESSVHVIAPRRRLESHRVKQVSPGSRRRYRATCWVSSADAASYNARTSA